MKANAITSSFTKLIKACSIAVVSVTLLLHGTSLANAQDQSPSVVVETMVSSILSLLGSDFSVNESRPQISSAISIAFDSRTMAQSVLANNWRSASDAQKDEFEILFGHTLESTYIGRLESYSDEVVEYGNEGIDNNRAFVNTVIITASADIPVNYKLRLRPSGWLIYDVEVENVSLVSSYRDTYRSIIRRSGMNDLLEQMRNKIAELEQ